MAVLFHHSSFLGNFYNFFGCRAGWCSFTPNGLLTKGVTYCKGIGKVHTCTFSLSCISGRSLSCYEGIECSTQEGAKGGVQWFSLRGVLYIQNDKKKGSKGPVGFGEINSDLVTGAEEPREQLDWHKLEMSEAVCRASWPSPPKDALNQCKSRTLLDPLSSPHLTLLPCFLGNPDVCCWCFTDASSTVSSSDSLCSSRQGADLSSVSGPAYQQDVATTGTGTGKHGFRSFWKLEEVSRCLLIQ